MTELLVLDLVRERFVTHQMVLTVGYDIENLTDPTVSNSYSGEVTTDRYGRKIPKHAHGTANLDRQTSSTKLIVEAVIALFDRIMNPKLLVRGIYLTANHVVPESEAAGQPETEQLDLFTDYAAEQAADLEREKRMQHAMLKILIVILHNLNPSR